MKNLSKIVTTRFLSPATAAQVVAKNGLPKTLTDMAEAIREDFLRWEEFEKSARVANHSRDGVIELMPISDDHLYAFKYVNGHPKNYRFNLPTVMAFGLLAEVDTGSPILLSELTLITALRTAAMSALAAKVLARKNSQTMAIIGNGAQSEFQAVAFHTMLGINRFHLFDVDHAASLKLQANLQALGLSAHIFADTKSAVKGCDIVTTVTADKTNATIITEDMLEDGMHINGVGGDCPGKTELAEKVLTRSRIFVEFEPQTRIEGDIQQLPSTHPVTEFWQVLSGKAEGRKNDEETTVFDSVGFALEDYSALRTMNALALSQGVRDTISLIPQLENPKNLYSLLIPATEKVVVSA